MIPVQPLPYAPDALEPVLGRDLVQLHYERHYVRYVERTNEMTDGRFTSTADAVHWARSRSDLKLFEQAAQAWSHEVYFNSMAPPSAGPTLTADLLRLLGHDFVDRWVAAAESVFGSGWVWLIATPDAAPRIVATKDAAIPAGLVLLVMDVWEHAYWCDYPGERKAYARAWATELAVFPPLSKRWSQRNR